MRSISTTLLALGFTALASSAFAACPDDTTASIQPKTGISKDGTHAPLETPDASASAETGTQGQVAKDGNAMPLEEANRDIATSQQDVEAQQKGEETAAQMANTDCKE
jgi:hypothetical protein